MIVQEIVDFFKKSTQLSILSEAELRTMARNASLEFFPAGALILKEGGAPSKYLYIVKKGAAVLFAAGPDGVEIPIHIAAEGDMFGYGPMMQGAACRMSVRAMHDMLSYQIGRDAVQDLADRNPALQGIFLRALGQVSMERSFEELRRKSAATAVDSSAGGWMDRLIYSAKSGEVSSDSFVSGPAELSIQEAARRMTTARKNSMVLTGDDGRPAGIVTDTDFREKVAALGLDATRPVREIMSAPAIAVTEATPCFEALLTMLRHDIHHVLVLGVDNDARVVGMLSDRDMVMLQGGSPLVLSRRIEDAEDLMGVREAAMGMDMLIGFLLKEGIGACHIARIASELSERIIRRVLDLAHRELGPPPVPYCFIVFGSEGRREQAYRTDQDNAIIYGDPASPAEASEAGEYFEKFATRVKDSLASCGYPPCPAGYMASNESWRQPLKVWKRQIAGWISAPSAESMLRSLIFFDFRPAGGDPALSESLRDHLHAFIASNRNFLGFMANQIVKNVPPLGFLGSFVVEKSGEHKDSLNLKVKGIAPLVDAVRLFSLEKGIRRTSTVERVLALSEGRSIAAEMHDDLSSAFEFLLHLRLLHHRDMVELGERPDNFINPFSLSGLEKRTLKQAFGLIASLQSLIIERYKPFIR